MWHLCLQFFNNNSSNNDDDDNNKTNVKLDLLVM